MWTAVGVYFLQPLSGLAPQIPGPLRITLQVLSVAALVVFIVGIVVAARRYSEWLKGRCHQCGYSRRGLDAEALCPECGVGPPGSMSIPPRVLGKDGVENGPPGPFQRGTDGPRDTELPRP